VISTGSDVTGLTIRNCTRYNRRTHLKDHPFGTIQTLPRSVEQPFGI
jgi:hypothetical protein